MLGGTAIIDWSHDCFLPLAHRERHFFESRNKCVRLVPWFVGQGPVTQILECCACMCIIDLECDTRPLAIILCTEHSSVRAALLPSCQIAEYLLALQHVVCTTASSYKYQVASNTLIKSEVLKSGLLCLQAAGVGMHSVCLGIYKGTVTLLCALSTQAHRQYGVLSELKYCSLLMPPFAWQALPLCKRCHWTGGFDQSDPSFAVRAWPASQ